MQNDLCISGESYNTLYETYFITLVYSSFSQVLLKVRVTVAGLWHSMTIFSICWRFSLVYIYAGRENTYFGVSKKGLLHFFITITWENNPRTVWVQRKTFLHNSTFVFLRAIIVSNKMHICCWQQQEKIFFRKITI